MDKLVLFMNNTEYLKIILQHKNDTIDCCYEAEMILQQNNISTVIAHNTVLMYAEQLQQRLHLALNNQLQLDDSIINDPGYYWNRWLNEKNPDLVCTTTKNGTYWIGNTYFLWSTSGGAPHKFSTWLYNNHAGQIVLQVCPLFAGTLVDWDDALEMQAYQQWLKNEYQAFYTHVISTQTAQAWLDQINTIINEIKYNE
jgi:hypothetical protein